MTQCRVQSAVTQGTQSPISDPNPFEDQMTQTRRQFLSATAALTLLPALPHLPTRASVGLPPRRRPSSLIAIMAAAARAVIAELP